MGITGRKLYLKSGDSAFGVNAMVIVIALFSVVTGRYRKRRRRPERADDELDAVVEDQAVGRGQRVGRLVVVVIGDDLDLVFLAGDIETALAVDIFGGELGGALHRNAPGGAGAGERRKHAELERLGGSRLR